MPGPAARHAAIPLVRQFARARNSRDPQVDRSESDSTRTGRVGSIGSIEFEAKTTDGDLVEAFRRLIVRRNRSGARMQQRHRGIASQSGPSDSGTKAGAPSHGLDE